MKEGWRDEGISNGCATVALVDSPTMSMIFTLTDGKSSRCRTTDQSARANCKLAESLEYEYESSPEFGAERPSAEISLFRLEPSAAVIAENVILAKVDSKESR